MASEQQMDGFTIPSGPKISIDKRTQETEVSNALVQQDRRRDERIAKTWNRLFGDESLVRMLPVSYEHKHEFLDYQINKASDGTCVSLPLVGGGEIRLGKSIKVEEGKEMGKASENLIIGITAHDAHGELVTLPDIEVDVGGVTK